MALFSVIAASLNWMDSLCLCHCVNGQISIAVFHLEAIQKKSGSASEQCVRERERETEKDRESERNRQNECVDSWMVNSWNILIWPEWIYCYAFAMLFKFHVVFIRFLCHKFFWLKIDFWWFCSKYKQMKVWTARYTMHTE